MPVYEYRCSGGHEYEKTEGFDAPSEQECIRCGAPARRMISMPAVIFKGSGFYSTDNRKSSGPTETKSSANGSKAETTESTGDSNPKIEAGVD